MEHLCLAFNTFIPCLQHKTKRCCMYNDLTAEKKKLHFCKEQ